MTKIDLNNSAAFIGVFGTLLGVILGSVLNRFARFGRVKIFQNSISVSLFESDSIGGFIKTKEITAKTNMLSIILNIDLYNTSALSRKVLRNIKIGIRTNKSLFKNRFNFYFSNTDKILNINLLPQENLNLELNYSTSNEFQDVLNFDWYIVYKNQKDKIKTCRIKKQ